MLRDVTSISINPTIDLDPIVFQLVITIYGLHQIWTGNKIFTSYSLKVIESCCNSFRS